MPHQLRQQEQQWRGIFESPGYRAPEKWTKSTDPTEIWASVWIKTVHQKMKLAADARRAHRAVLAQIEDAKDAEAGLFDPAPMSDEIAQIEDDEDDEDAEAGRFDPAPMSDEIDTVDLTGDEPIDVTRNTSHGPASTLRPTPVQRLPATRPISPPCTTRTPSQSAERGRKRRRSNTPQEDRAIDAVAQPTAADESLVRLTEPVTKRLGTGDCPQSIAGVYKRLAELKEHFMRRNEVVHTQFDNIIKLFMRQHELNLSLVNSSDEASSEVSGDGRREW
jgi:hypothetical protein